MNAPLPVRVHFDFASTLCYVAHRALARIADEVATLGIELIWTPLELTRLLGHPGPGAPVDELRRVNAARVAAELGIAVRVPRLWPDVHLLGAAALVADSRGRGPSFRERAFNAVFEEGLVAVDAGCVGRLARDVALELPPRTLAEAVTALADRSETAREEGVTGVPTFMLGRWPFGGIQSDDTMLRVFERFARRSREGSLA